MAMLAAIGMRIVHAVVLLLAVIVLNFFLIQLAPGDPAEVIAGSMGGANEEMMQQIRAAYGLDRTLPEQLAIYLGRVVQGDLGYSFYFNQPVSELILRRVPATLLLVVTALVLAIVVGTVLGVIASRKPNGWFSQFVTILSLAGYSTPVFWTGIMLLILFSGTLQLFPVSGMADPTRVAQSTPEAILDVLHHLALPAFTLAIVYIAFYSRLSRASMLETLGADYVRTARAKGLSETKVVYKHALRNAILPVVTMAGLQFSQLFAGAILVETVFNWPGMGRLAFESILRRDHPTILGILFFSALVVMVVNLLTDLSYRLIDPRIRARGSGH